MIATQDGVVPIDRATGARAVAAVAATVLVVDQMTKWLMVYEVMQPPRIIPVFPGFNLTLGFNTGASFGLLGDAMKDNPLLMAALTGTIALAFTVMAVRARRPLERAGLALIVGGALGNIVDRLRQGAVTDFIDLYWRTWHWPAFNVADIAITLGVVCILISAFPSRRRETVHDRT